MKITILSVGKIKEKYLRDAIAEYEKRLGRYCRILFEEVADEKTPDTVYSAEAEIVKKKEGERLLSKIGEGEYVVALEIQGKMMSSEEFSGVIGELGLHGNSDVCFVIGGSLGLSKEVLDRANMKISFSKMTFPHQLMRVILLEQIYRGFRILRGEPYHK